MNMNDGNEKFIKSTKRSKHLERNETDGHFWVLVLILLNSNRKVRNDLHIHTSITFLDIFYGICPGWEEQFKDI